MLGKLHVLAKFFLAFAVDKLHVLQAKASTPPAVSKLKGLATEAESPDSPLVFPWSQGPNSTGAASGYASLSDSYLSRPPSQSPSQAPSPSKQAQHAHQGLASTAAASAQHVPPGTVATRQHSAFSALTGSNSNARSPIASSSAALLSPVKSPQHTKQAFQVTTPAAPSDSPSSTVQVSSSPLESLKPSSVKLPYTAQAVPPWRDSSSMQFQVSQRRPVREPAQPAARQLPWEGTEPAQVTQANGASHLDLATAHSSNKANGVSQLDLATAHSSSSGGEAEAVATEKAASGLRILHKGLYVVPSNT